MCRAKYRRGTGKQKSESGRYKHRLVPISCLVVDVVFVVDVVTVVILVLAGVDAVVVVVVGVTVLVVVLV